MKLKSILLLSVALGVCSCGKKEPEAPVQPAEVVHKFSGKEAAEVREQTIIELLAIKKGVKQSIVESRTAKRNDSFVRDLESLRPRLEYIHMQMKRLPKSEQMVVRGNLAVTTNQLERELKDIIAQDPANDDLAVEVAHLRKQLSPIPLASVMRQQ